MNAARELAALLEKWAVIPNGQSVAIVHGGDDLASWRRHVEAMDLVAQIHRILLTMEAAGRNTEHYRRSEAEWVKGIVMPNIHWGEGQGGDNRVIQQSTIDQLLGLADYVDSMAAEVRLDEAGRTQSSDALDELIGILNGDSLTLSLQERHYVFALINELRSAFSEAEVFDGLDLLRRINELVGYLNGLAEDVEKTGDKNLAAKLRDVGSRVRPFVFRGALFAAGAIQTAAAAKELLS